MVPASVAAVISVVAAFNTDAPAYDLVLLAHVLAALVGLVAVVAAGASALALRGPLARGGPVPDALVRYFRPGINWAGRVLFLVPVLGVVLLAMSEGQWGFADTWVSFSMAVWAAVAIVAEAVLWPAERRLQEIVSTQGTPEFAPEPEDRTDGSRTPDELCLRSGVVGLGLGIALVLVGVLMVAKP